MEYLAFLTAASLNPSSLAASGIDLKVLTTPSGEVDFKFISVGFLPAILFKVTKLTDFGDSQESPIIYRERL